MGWLNDTLSKNANLALERAMAEAEKKNEKLSFIDVARRMVVRLPRQRGAWKAEDLAKILRELLAGKRRWNADYIEGFAGAIGTMPERLVAADYDEAKVDPATYAKYLTANLGRQLDAAEIRTLVASVERQLEIPGLFELTGKISESLRGAVDADQAIGRAARLILRSRLWAEDALPDRHVRDDRHTVSKTT